MTTKTYLFYDIETTGLNKCFDQVIQFAAIRTDLKLNELERTEIKIKLNPDVIPSPYALITHHIGIHATKNDLTELEGIEKIHALINTPGTISLGYNTLGFDDEFLRFSFFKNLLPPYTHQFANQCSRMDIYPIAVMYYLYKPSVLRWPMIDGRVSLKLDNLNAENQLAEGRAHDAMVDVLATVALARKLFQEKEMWNYVTGYFNKKTDLERAAQLTNAFSIGNTHYKEGLCIQGKMGNKKNFQAPVLGLGQHRHYKNQSLWLMLDHEDLQKTTENNIADMTWVIRKKAGEDPLLLPTSERFFGALDPARQQRAQDNKAWLQKKPELLQKIADYHQHYKYPEVDNVDIDAVLYMQGFPTPQEDALYRQFHGATPDKKLNIADRFPNKHRREQAVRVVGRCYPALLQGDDKTVYEEYLDACFSHDAPALRDFKGSLKLTPAQAMLDIATIRKERELSDEQEQLLQELEKELAAVV